MVNFMHPAYVTRFEKQSACSMEYTEPRNLGDQNHNLSLFFIKAHRHFHAKERDIDGSSQPKTDIQLKFPIVDCIFDGNYMHAVLYVDCDCSSTNPFADIDEPGNERVYVHPLLVSVKPTFFNILHV